MKYRKNYVRLMLAALITVSAIGLTFAQDTNSALKIYHEWGAKNLTGEMSAEGNHLEIAFAVSRYKKIGATINIVVGVGSNVNGLGEMRFAAQPMTVKKSPDGKALLEKNGDSGTLVFPELSDAEDREGDIVASPQLTIKAPAGTEAIQIVVKESSSAAQFTIILPLRDVVTTAVLAGKIDTKKAAGLLGKCSWYYSPCGDPCGQLCVACNNNSPVFNCVTCTESCAGDGACTGAGPKPVNCP